MLSNLFFFGSSYFLVCEGLLPSLLSADRRPRSATKSEENQTTTRYNPSGADAPAPFTQGSLLKRSLLGDNNGLLITDAAAMTRTEPETDGRAPLCKGSSRAAGEGLYPILVRRPQGRERGKNTNIYEEPIFYVRKRQIPVFGTLPFSGSSQSGV